MENAERDKWLVEKGYTFFDGCWWPAGMISKQWLDISNDDIEKIKSRAKKTKDITNDAD